jgi:hypothetical protein
MGNKETHKKKRGENIVCNRNYKRPNRLQKFHEIILKNV